MPALTFPSSTKSVLPVWQIEAYCAFMGSSYHQFCPVAKAMELLDERWTMLIIRELLLGSRHFNDLRRGVPKMSPSLLSKRLHDRAGIVERRHDGHEVEYRLTAAGKEAKKVARKVTKAAARKAIEKLEPLT